MAKAFKGVININVKDSTPDWDPYLTPKAPEGAPNVLIVLYDDTGIAAWSPYGGRIEMPTMDKLASRGLTYSQWHTTALCSPTRSCMLTGRNHHQNGFASIAEASTGFPGSNAHIPMENAYLAQVLRERGWNTFWIGKNHNVAIDEVSMGSSKRNWPILRGFDRFYGFLGGETDQWFPTLVEDMHYTEQPYTPDQGYHLSKDLADHAISFIRDSKQAAPDKPWFTFFCPGANHAPHHAPKDWIDRYKGKFDDGYEAYREWVLPRMIERGILPEGTDLTQINPMPDGTFSPGDSMRPWASLNDDEKKLFSRMAEVYAGFSSYTDHQVGRIVEYLEASGQLDNTLVIYCADNGASGEGSPNGSVNENKFFNGWPDEMAENLTMLDKLGGPETYNHYPTGWAVAFSTPYKMFKRYSYQGGVADPLVISWPKGIKARGEVREQYHHVIDIVPTILECCGITFPDVVQGYDQTALPGVSMAYSFDNAKAPTKKEIQYYEMMGTRGLWHKGWKVVATHGALHSTGHFNDDRWELYHTDEDRSEAHDLADKMPDKVKEMVEYWFSEAGKYNVLPMDDRSSPELANVERPMETSSRSSYVYYPGTLEVPESAAVNVRSRSFRIVAQVDVTDANAEGVIFAQGSRFGGHALYLKDKKLHYTYNFLGIPPEQRFVSEALAPGKHVLGMEFEKKSTGKYGESHGTTTLYVDEKAVASGDMRTQVAWFALCGEGLCIGRDSSDAVSSDYSNGFPFKGGTIHQVEVSVGDDQYIDLEKLGAAILARE